MSPTLKAQTKNSTAILKNLEVAIKEALQLSNALSSFGDLQNENKKLQQQLEMAEASNKQKDQQLQEHGKEISSMFENFEKRFHEWSKMEEVLRNQIQDIQEESAKKTRSNQEALSKKCREYDADLSHLQRQLNDQTTLASGFKSRLEKTETCLQHLKGDIGVGELRPAFVQDLRTLESSLHTLCARFFPDPPLHVHQGDNRMVVQQPGNFHRASRLASFLVSSVYPRPLVAQAIIAEDLSTMIFSPLYMASPVSRISMGEAIQRSNQIRPQQKAILRSLFFKAFSTEEKRLQDDIVGSVSIDVMEELEPLLSRRGGDAFREELENFLRSAVCLRDAVRGCTQWIIATYNSNMFCDSWRFYGNTDQTIAPSTSGPAAMVLFPHIFCEGGEKPLYPGLLWVKDSDSRPQFSDDNDSSSRCQSERANSTIGTAKVNGFEYNSKSFGTGRLSPERKGKSPVSGSSAAKGRDAKRPISRKSRFHGKSGD